jgi:pectinesterase
LNVRRSCSVVLPMALLAYSISAQSHAVKVFPENRAKHVNPDTHLVLTFSSAPTLGTSGTIRIYDAADHRLVDTLDLSIPTSPNPSGRLPEAALNAAARAAAAGTVKDPNQYQVDTIAGLDFHFRPIIIHDRIATVYPHHNALEYGHKYIVKVDSTVLKPADGEFSGFNTDTAWTFTTKAAPPSANTTRVVVAADGTGDFSTVQGAIDFVPANAQKRVTIFIKKGNYEEIVFLRDKSNITFRGEDREKVQVGYANNSAFNPPKGGPSRRPAFSLYDVSDIQLSNFTINNYLVGQAEALLVRGSHIVVDHMTLNGSGDALTTYGTLYVVDSKLTGHGDTILGYAAAYFLRSEIDSIGPFSWTRTPANSHGNVFVDCTFVAIDKPLPWTVTPTDPGQKVASVFARLPRNSGGVTSMNFPYAEMVLINTKTQGLSAAGWGPIEEAPGFDSSNVKFWEYNTTDMDGHPIDISQRHAVSKQLTMPADAQKIADYSKPEFVLDGWKPEVE